MSFEITSEIKKIFYEILEKKQIKAVYQPIVSLRSGKILGYEALSRIQHEKCPFNIEQLFIIADKLGHLWEIEELCRKKDSKALPPKKQEQICL